MKRWFLIFGFSVIYYTAAWYGLKWFDAGLVTTALFLYGIPALLLSHYSYAPASVLLSVASLGLGIGVLLESVAHIYGLWYTLGAAETRLFDLVPAEMLVTTVLQSIFLVLLYELFFDDGIYTKINARARMGAFMVFAFGTIILVALQQYLFSGFFLTYSYVWLIVIILTACIAALGVYRAYSIRFFRRMVHFALIGAVPGAIALALAIANSHKFFANPEQYLYTITMFGEMVAIEEILLVLAIPFLVGTIYELYLDDKS